jgi:diguanylate cyclase (GGDEF)-like protein
MQAGPQWQLDIAAQQFQRYSGLLDGGLIVLALFIAITAIINKEKKFVLFSVWLVVNLRMAALSMGWDQQWLGKTIPADWLVHLRAFTLAVYFATYITLFKSIFNKEIKGKAERTLLGWMVWMVWPILMLPIFLPYAQFLPIIWTATGLGVLLFVVLVIRIIIRTKSRSAIWYVCSTAVALLSSFQEVVSAAMGVNGLLWAANSLTAALASSLLASISIAEHMRDEHQQRLQAQEHLRHAYDAMPIGLFTLDLQGRFLDFNPSMQLLMDSQNIKEMSWQDVMGIDNWSQLHRDAMSGESIELQIQSTHPTAHGQYRFFLVKALLSDQRIEGSLQDISTQVQATGKLQFLATHDPLTRTLNRHGIEKAMQSLDQMLAFGASICFMYLDINGFKRINDLHGHGVGDEVLQQLASRVMGMLSPHMHIGRIGGDEFLIIIPNTRCSMATAIAQGILDCISIQAYQVGHCAIHVRCSAGLVDATMPMQFQDVVTSADHACRNAKVGTNSLVVFDKQSAAFMAHEANMQLIARFANADVLSGLYLVMQPIMALKSPLQSMNAEMLLRMNDVNGRSVSTSQLIAAAENSGRMSEIDLWVVQSTLEWLRVSRHRLQHIGLISMNIHGASLNDDYFAAKIYDLLKGNPDLATLICLEITESVALRDIGNTRRFIGKVRGYGAKIALDDFGAGYTSFSYLKELPADLLKIDGQFIYNMNRHPRNIAIVETIIALSHNLGMKVVAEWAEDLDTIETLVEIQADYVQGFIVAKPLALDRFLDLQSVLPLIEDAPMRDYVMHLGSAPPQLSLDIFGVEAVNTRPI